MTDPARLRAQMAELGVKFLERTRAEAVTILALIDRLGAADCGPATQPACTELAYLVHRIHGGGATFGFNMLSEQAGEMERLLDPVARNGQPVTAELVKQLRALGMRLRDSALQAAPS